MAIGKKRKLGRTIEEISVGEKCKLTEKITDRDLLLYLGLTDDNNPLFIQHDYASLTPYKKPIVPQIMLIGFITAATSKILPGPGSSVLRQNIDFIKPVHHYSTVEYLLEVTAVDIESHVISLSVEARNEDKELVIKGTMDVSPPYPPQSITTRTFENF